MKAAILGFIASSKGPRAKIGSVKHANGRVPFSFNIFNDLSPEPARRDEPA